MLNLSITHYLGLIKKLVKSDISSLQRVLFISANPLYYSLIRSFKKFVYDWYFIAPKILIYFPTSLFHFLKMLNLSIIH